MAVTLALLNYDLDIDMTNKEFIIYGTFTLSGNYGGAATNGDTFNLGISLVQSLVAPLYVEVFEQPPAGTAPTGYTFIYCPGTNISNGVLAIFQGAGTAGPATQITEGAAYPAALVGPTFGFRAWVQKFF